MSSCGGHMLSDRFDRNCDCNDSQEIAVGGRADPTAASNADMLRLIPQRLDHDIE